MDSNSAEGSLKAAREHQKDEVSAYMELNLNIVTSKQQKEAPTIEAQNNYTNEDPNQLEHHSSSTSPSNDGCDKSVSHFPIYGSKKVEEPRLSLQSDIEPDGKMKEPLNLEGHSNPELLDIHHDENGYDASFSKMASALENKKPDSVDIEESALPLQKPFGFDTDHYDNLVMKDDCTQDGNELPVIYENDGKKLLCISESSKSEGLDPHIHNPGETNGDDHGEMKRRFHNSITQLSGTEESEPRDFPQKFQEQSASPEARERSSTPDRHLNIQGSEQNESDMRRSPCSSRSPRHEFSSSPRRPDEDHRKTSSDGQVSSPKRRKITSPLRKTIGDSGLQVDSSCERRESFSPGGKFLQESDKKTCSSRDHLSVSPPRHVSRQDSPSKYGSPNKQDSLGRQGSPWITNSPLRQDSLQREGSPGAWNSQHDTDSSRRQDSPSTGHLPTIQDSPLSRDFQRRLDKSHRGDSPGRKDVSQREGSPRRQDLPRKTGSSQRRDSPRRRGSPQGRASSKGDPPRKHMSSSPQKRESSRRKDRSVSRSPPRRRESSGNKRHDRSRSRSPYGRDYHRRSPRRRHSSRHRSPSPGFNSRRHSPRRRHWSPPSNRNRGIGRPGKNLFVAGFSFATMERDLEKKFSRFGRVTDVRVVRDRRSGDSRGFGFLSFERDEEADAAIRALDQTEWNGRIVLVEKAKTAAR